MLSHFIYAFEYTQFLRWLFLSYYVRDDIFALACRFWAREFIFTVASLPQSLARSLARSLIHWLLLWIHVCFGSLNLIMNLSPSRAFHFYFAHIFPQFFFFNLNAKQALAKEREKKHFLKKWKRKKNRTKMVRNVRSKTCGLAKKEV